MPKLSTKVRFLVLATLPAAALLPGCGTKSAADLRIKEMDSTLTARIADSIGASVKPEIADDLTLRLWGIDSLVISPIAIDVDDQGQLYYTTTSRQKNSEFDIRGHRDWEIPSISLQTVEDRRAFLHKELSPENSHRNKWLKDLNGDSSHDWRDLTVEKEHVYRLQDVNGDGVADRSQLVVDDFNDEVTDVAGGVLSHDGNLYVAVAPDLWKMRDKNNDGIADEKTSLSHGYGIHIGFSGHGMSGIEMGPDGRLYWQIGDIGFNGTGPDGKKWEHPNSGVIARCNPDGSDFEIFAHGTRNTHKFVFDEYGNLISEDNDGDHPGEKERLVYIVNGSDAGWRSNWQYGKYRDPLNNGYKVWMDEKMYLPRFEGQAAYITPCIANFVSGPTGMVYNPGTALGPGYKHTFFIAEFVGNPSGSGIHSFKLQPKGATFELGEHKKILGGVLATGLDFGPDGALYVADWIDGWDTHDYGRIWKLDHKDAANAAIRREVKTLLAADFSDRKEADLGQLLQHEDMRIRQKAQFELVRRGEAGADIFRNTLRTSHQLARIHAIWGLSQMARKDKKYAGALQGLLADNDPEIRAQAARWLGDTRHAAAAGAILPLLKDTAARVRFFAAEALGRIQYEPAVQPLIAMLEANNDADAYLRHAGSLALARIGKAGPVAALASHPSRAVRIAAVVALRRMAHAGVAQFLQDKDEFVVTEAARAINDDLSIPAALPALAALINTTPFTNEALLRRVLSANLRVGTEDDALPNLIRYAQNEKAPAAMRAEAVAIISVWTAPSVLDRVDGRLRGPAPKASSNVAETAGGPLTQLLRDKNLDVRISAAKAVDRLGIKTAGPALLSAVLGDAEPTMRVEALKALVTLQDPRLGQAIKHALGDREKKVRVAGLDLLEKMNIPKNTMVSLLTDVINTKTMEEQQAAVLTLGRLPAEHAGKALEGLLDKMEAGKLGAGIYLELGEALDSLRSQPLIDRYKKLSGKPGEDDLMASYASCLEGGDPQRGRQVFYRNQNAQCMKCHAYDDRGGNAGPRLNGIAGRISREQILEALIAPGNRLAPGFGMVTLELKNGQKLTGVLHGESKTGITVKEGLEPERTIAMADIVKKTYAPSSMPDMKAILSKKEIRDVVSFLAESKEDN